MNFKRQTTNDKINPNGKLQNPKQIPFFKIQLPNWDFFILDLFCSLQFEVGSWKNHDNS